MAFLERDQDLAVIVGDEGAIAEGEIVVAGRQADIVQHQAEILVGNRVADLVLDRGKGLFGGLDALPGPGADMERELACVDLREVILADEEEQGAADHQNDGGNAKSDDAPRQQYMQQSDIALMEAREATFEPRMEAAEESLRLGIGLLMNGFLLMICLRLLRRPLTVLVLLL